MRRLNSSGFTILELLLAMTFFSFVLMFMTAGFVFVSRQYTRGIIVREVQDADRFAIEDMARNLRLSDVSDDQAARCDGSVSSSACADLTQLGIENQLCLANGVTYQWEEPDTTEAAAGVETNLWKTNGCTDGVDERTPMLSERVSVYDIQITPVGPKTYRLTLVLVANGEELTVANNSQLPTCATVAGPGSQYCDVVSLSSVVTSR